MIININNLKKIKSEFPILLGKNFISKKNLEKLINEITNAKSFDDLIQGGRNRINKGSKNFNDYLIKSKLSKNFISNLIQNYFTINLRKNLKILLRIANGLILLSLKSF